MRSALSLAAAVSLLALNPVLALAKPDDAAKADKADKDARSDAARNDPDGVPDPDSATTTRFFKARKVLSSGMVTVGGQKIDYTAEAGTVVVHQADWDDTDWRETAAAGKTKDDAKDAPAEASMFYTAYFKKGAPSADRPITFLFNGGPGSATVWLHMGAFGPRRVITANDSHTPPAPYNLVDNAYSLLDASDLVFIDAPGAGWSRIAGKNKEKAFWGVDQDVHAFREFIKAFLSDHGRWNSPKFLLGESYGTPRASALVNALQSDDSIDFNGVVLLSAILNFDLSADGPEHNPGVDSAYVVSLPTVAATAWYHNRLPGTRPADLETFLREVEHFATTDYAMALMQGSTLPDAQRQDMAKRLAGYTGIPAEYWLRSNLRLNVGQVMQHLQEEQGLTTGRLDSRFSGPTLDPTAKEAGYDPQSAAISSAYISAFNAYARDSLHYATQATYKPFAGLTEWDMTHRLPDGSRSESGPLNVMPDLANAMKQNPQLKVLLAGGYYDLATPYFEGLFETRHLPMPQSLQGNISFAYYPSGHMVYANEASLKGFHDATAAFIARNSGKH
ncbi:MULTISPECIES: S10 family peptidase [unclassified Novosphingobium]|uniref:S10 family peptidase n=1 Tax=unclassified Novosphingobium TaxID=2644732 RepID=UPI000D316D73|nr:MULTISPECIES: peptidase S10 [unclassified Novosphingobium]PTR12413.1 carboxypeptidase C (cathepsin A) [Novosphingobium sp. GV055]PUB05814.1 carboxypeptidase C (cathepsin A) [Novosphingobium sp. GV061]PUB22047.1 carboxypeptidase C (cathepsin A) [Novosphingobium sp. GV079]PUB43820.1 carboxypeptidase C (cathepsin A) [Novosphingobium sp. GV027]